MIIEIRFLIFLITLDSIFSLNLLANLRILYQELVDPQEYGHISVQHIPKDLDFESPNQFLILDQVYLVNWGLFADLVGNWLEWWWHIYNFSLRKCLGDSLRSFWKDFAFGLVILLLLFLLWLFFKLFRCLWSTERILNLLVFHNF